MVLCRHYVFAAMLLAAVYLVSSVACSAYAVNMTRIWLGDKYAALCCPVFQVRSSYDANVITEVLFLQGGRNNSVIARLVLEPRVEYYNGSGIDVRVLGFNFTTVDDAILVEIRFSVYVPRGLYIEVPVVYLVSSPIVFRFWFLNSTMLCMNLTLENLWLYRFELPTIPGAIIPRWVANPEILARHVAKALKSGVNVIYYDGVPIYIRRVNATLCFNTLNSYTYLLAGNGVFEKLGYSPLMHPILYLSLTYTRVVRENLIRFYKVLESGKDVVEKLVARLNTSEELYEVAMDVASKLAENITLYNFTWLGLRCKPELQRVG